MKLFNTYEDRAADAVAGRSKDVDNLEKKRKKKTPQLASYHSLSATVFSREPCQVSWQYWRNLGADDERRRSGEEVRKKNESWSKILVEPNLGVRKTGWG